jgi:hypothetical protein
MRERVTGLAAAAGLSAALLAGGCSIQDAVCRSGEYPVKQVGSTTGAACVPDDEEPPAGYVRYPAGKVPKHVDDEWDKYWRGKALDANGNLLPVGL